MKYEHRISVIFASITVKHFSAFFLKQKLTLWDWLNLETASPGKLYFLKTSIRNAIFQFNNFEMIFSKAPT